MRILKELNSLFCAVNSVTVFHRHGNKVPNRNLDLLCDSQIERLEKLIKAIENCIPEGKSVQRWEMEFRKKYPEEGLLKTVSFEIDEENNRIVSKIGNMTYMMAKHLDLDACLVVTQKDGTPIVGLAEGNAK